MDRLLKLSVIAAMAMAATACGGKDDSLKCDAETYETECLSTNTYMICNNGTLITHTCAAGLVCDPSTAKCVNAGVGESCTTNDDCKGDLICTNGKCAAVLECTRDSDCAGSLICSAEGKCVNGSTPDCTNGAKQCSATGIPQVCADGAWTTLEACAEGQKCLTGVCIDEDADCVDNTKQCSDAGIPELCVSGKWAAQDECEDGLVCSDGNCIKDDKCTTNDDCDDDFVCTAEGKCVAVAECTTNDDCDDGLICTAEGICIEVVECTTSDDCDDDLICSEGICIQAVECESNADCEGNLICSAEGLCIAECTTNANCEGDFVCSDNKCVECINEALQCSLTGIPQLCADNVWVEQAACDADDGQVCVDGACVCENGAQRCGEMGIPDLCVDGAWVAQTPCAGLTRCVEGECATISSEKTCEEADRCEGTTAYHCLNGTMRTWNCPTSSPFGATNATCIIADADGKAWCANKNPVDYCDYDYEFLGLFNPQASSCRWESGYLNHASCVASGGNDYVIDAYTHSVCLEDADGPYRLLCAGNNVAVEDCDLDCVEDGWATMCLEPACESGSQRCSLTGIPQVCVSEIWVNKPACTGLQTCASGNCVDVPVAGEPCSGATFPEQCSGNVAYYCNNSAKIAAWNCTPNSGKCFESKSGGAVSADCGYPDSACTSEGQVMFYSNQYACQLYSSHRAIIYDVCYMSDGKLYLVEDLVAASVCQNNNRRHCSSSSAIATQSCGSNTCTFDGWDAVCM